MSAPENILFDLLEIFCDPGYQSFQLCRVYEELHYIVLIVYSPTGSVQFISPRAELD